MYQEPARVEKHRVAMQLYGCKIKLEQATDLILFSLPPSFSMFVMNYNMAGELKLLNELYSMLATAETTFKKAPEILL